MRAILAALVLLMLVGAGASAARLDEQRALEFIEQCRNTGDQTLALPYLYWGLMVLEDAGQESDAGQYASHVLSLQNEDGGFGFWPKDVSTPEGTLYALTVLRMAQADFPHKDTCAQYLLARLERDALTAERSFDPITLNELHSGLIALSMLGAEVPGIERYLHIFAQEAGARGLYCMLTVQRAFGLPVTNRQALISQLASITTSERVHGAWRIPELHYAVESMAILGGTFPNIDQINSRMRRLPRAPLSSEGPRGLVGLWRTIRVAKLLGKETPWLEKRLERLPATLPVADECYGPTPGALSELRASFLAFELVGQQGAPPEALVQSTKRHQQDAGYFESWQLSPPERFTDSDRTVHRVAETWQALVGLQLAGEAPDKPDALAGWLGEVLDQHLDELMSYQVLQMLECMEMIGHRPENAPELFERLRQRFGSDLPLVIRASQVLGVDAEFPGAGDILSVLPDRVRVLKVPAEASLLRETFESLATIGEDYEGTDYFHDMLAGLQNPDGGVRKPDSPHSNIYDTVAAVRMARALDILEARRAAHRNEGLVISVPRTDSPPVLDGKIFEWDDAARVSFQENSARAKQDPNSTDAFAMWDDECLYLAFRVKDANLQAHPKKRDAGDIYLDDGVEFLIDPHFERTRTYLPNNICVHISLAGAIDDDHGTTQGRIDRSWHGDVRFAFELDGTLNDDSPDEGYGAEIALPWTELGWVRGVEGARMGIDLCVNDRDRKEDRYHYSDWAGAPKFHVPCDWGMMELVGETP